MPKEIMLDKDKVYDDLMFSDVFLQNSVYYEEIEGLKAIVEREGVYHLDIKLYGKWSRWCDDCITKEDIERFKKD